MKIILASNSPRRKEILGQLVDDFEIRVSNADEELKSNNPIDEVLRLSNIKASTVKRNKNEMIIGSDTVVFFKNNFYNKPHSREDAINTIKILSGNVHTVYTGVTIIYNDFIKSFYDESKVEFNKLTDKQIENYIDVNKPYDKAGAYAIQDGVVVKGYSGSYYNIMGLPKEKLKTALIDLGVTVKE